MVLSVTVMLLNYSVAIMHVTVSATIIQFEVYAALICKWQFLHRIWGATIFIVFIQVGVSVATMQVVLSVVHNCFSFKMQVTVSFIAM